MQKEFLLLHINLLGQFALTLNQQPIHALSASRLQSVLAYLVLQCGTAQPRQQVAAAFWPDASDAQARNNLRQTVHQLRQVLPEVDRYLQADASTLRWCADATFSLDVAEYERRAAHAKATYKTGDLFEAQSALVRVASLYQGDLLPSCYEDWIAPERERLRNEFASLLKLLVDLLEKQRDFGQAIPYAQRLIGLDPLDEAATLGLMRLHALNGDRASALRAYQACAKALQQELGIEPNQAIREGYERLLRSDATFAQTGQAAPRQLVLDVPSPLIGRQPEWEQLQAAWQHVVRNEAHLVIVSGEAGIGKTRLAEELMVWASQQGFGVARARAYAAEGRLSYAPVTEWLRSEAVRGGLAGLAPVWLSEVARIVPELLIEWPDVPRPNSATDPTQRQHLFEALARAVQAAKQPLLLVLDDLQWCDQDTLEWLRYLLRFDALACLLIVGTVRPEEVDAKHPLTRLLLDLRSANQLTELELKRLDAAESARLAGHIVKRNVALTEATRLYKDTEGNPLFVVEMARAGLEQRGAGVAETGGRGEAEAVQLPPRVHAVMASRLAQLSEPALALAGLGATLGRAFRVDVLAHASGADEEAVLRSLDELWQRRIVRAQDGNTYDFTHDKLRDVAYAQLGPAKRRLLHKRAAQAIEAVHASDLDAVSAQLAAQFEMGELIVPAITHYLRAAKVARRIFASDQAWDFTNRGLALLEKVNKDKNCLELEYELLTMQSTGFGVVSNNAAHQFAALERTLQLGKDLGKPPNPSTLRALSTNYVIRARYRESIEAGEQLLQLAEQTSNQVLKVEAYEAIGITHYWTGTFDLSRAFLEKSLTLYESEQLKSHVDLFAWDPRIVSQSRLGLTLWSLGYPVQAWQKLQSSLSFAESVGHPFSLGYSVGMNSIAQMMLIGDVAASREQAQACLALSRKHKSLVWWLHLSRVTLAWADAATRTSTETVEEFENSLQEFYVVAPTCMRTCYHTLLAGLYASLGQFDRSWTWLADAHELARDTNECWYIPELHRTQGDVLLAQGASRTEAESAYKLAVETARAQQSKSFELRASTRLARLWQSHGKLAEAHDLLAPIYNWFTEGFDTHDLKQAKALLDALVLR